jgi:hypothetical protein
MLSNIAAAPSIAPSAAAAVCAGAAFPVTEPPLEAEDDVVLAAEWEVAGV